MARVEEIREIQVGSIEQNLVPRVHRAGYERAGLEQMVVSLRNFGLLQPLVVFEVSAHHYELVIGRRRFLGLRAIRAPQVLASILDEPVDVETAHEMWLNDNLMHSELTRPEVGELLTGMMRKHGTVEALAEHLGVPAERIRKLVIPFPSA